MTTPDDAFKFVADLMQRGHYFPDSVTYLREIAPRPPSETEKFLPGQRTMYMVDGVAHEQLLTDVEEWDDAEAKVVEKCLKSAKNEVYEWRLSELTAGTIRVTLTVHADFGALEKLSKVGGIKKFWTEAMNRMKSYIEDRGTFAGPRTFAPKPSPTNELDGPR